MITIQQQLQNSFPWYNNLNDMETDSDFDPIEYVSRKLRSEKRRRRQKNTNGSRKTSCDSDDSNSSTFISTGSPGSVTSDLSDDYQDELEDNTIRRFRPKKFNFRRNKENYISIGTRFQNIRQSLKQRRKWKRRKNKAKKRMFSSFHLTIRRRSRGLNAVFDSDDSADGIFIGFQDSQYQLKETLLQ